MAISCKGLLYGCLLSTTCIRYTCQGKTSENLKKVEEWTATHSNTWVVIVGASRFWYNYRHEANPLSIYRTVKRLGVHDSRIILMLGEDFACNPRNIYPGTIFNNGRKDIDVYGHDVEVDYRGYEVTPTNFVRILTGRHDDSVPRSKRLMSDRHSNVLIYLTGHGGEGFLKFQDTMVLFSPELGDSIKQMWQRRRYNELLFIADTCHAESLFDQIKSPHVIGMFSSNRHEDSYSRDRSKDLGVYTIDAFTAAMLQYMEGVLPDSNETLDNLFKNINKPGLLGSHPVLKYTIQRSEFLTKRITEFFGSYQSMTLPSESIKETLQGSLYPKALEPHVARKIKGNNEDEQFKSDFEFRRKIQTKTENSPNKFEVGTSFILLFALVGSCVFLLG
eukprot:m.29832 g.29832  ORF g.29832 m.29832 type:complete len:390 (+) comp8139_c0_seq4:26-1195(+)